MSDPVRDFIAASRDAALADRTPVTLAYAALADDVLTALDREREEARAATEFVCALLTNRPTWPNEWPQDVAAAALVVQRLRAADGATGYLAGWRAGRDAAMKAVYNEAYRKPQSPALGPEIEWLKAADLIRALPDPSME